MMSLEEYHGRFAGLTANEVIRKYHQSGLDSREFYKDFIYYCLPLREIGYVFLHSSLKSTRGSGFHPDVTPDMVASFMLDHLKPCINTAILSRFAEYDKIYEALQILLSNCKYYIDEHGLVNSKEGTELDQNMLLFIIDVFAENGYANSIKNNVSVEYFHPEFNKYVDEYRILCIKSIKTCH